jgi:RND family efflux transporter MFP subunit
MIERPHGRDESHIPVNTVPGTGRKLVIAVVVLILVLAAAFIVRFMFFSQHESALATETAQAASTPPPVDVVQVAAAPASYDLELPGDTRAWFESTIYARVSGYVSKWIVDIGDKVQAGQTMAEIATPELDDQLKAAQAKVNADEAEVSVAQATEKFAISANKSYQGAPQGSVGVLEAQQKAAEAATASAKLNAAKAQVRLDEADVARLKDLEQFKQVVAPYAGIVTERHIDIGDLVTAGSTNNNTVLYGLAQSDRMRIFVDVPQSVAPGIKVGTMATAIVHGLGDKPFAGKIARTSNSLDPAARTLKVEVDIENPNLVLVPGMYVQVKFHISEPISLVQVPAGALNFRSSGAQVAIVDNSGTVSFRPVNIVRDMGEYVEVDSGLKAGDKVALNISNQIVDGDRVTTNVMGTPLQPAPAGSTTKVAERTE